MIMGRKTTVALLAFVFMVALVYATPVEAKKPLRWLTACSINLPPWTPDNPTWIGDVYAEDGAHGEFYWFNTGAEVYKNENMQKFWGIWWAVWDDGSCVEGIHEGSFTYAIGQYTINGRVTLATGQFSDLVGRKIHTVGRVDMTGGIYGIGYSEGIFQIN
jgi:hypothetical protein